MENERFDGPFCKVFNSRLSSRSFHLFPVPSASPRASVFPARQMDPSTGQVSITDSGNLRSKSYQIALCAVDEGGKFGRSVLRVDVKTRSVKNDEVENRETQGNLKDFDVGGGRPRTRQRQRQHMIMQRQQPKPDDGDAANEPKANEKHTRKKRNSSCSLPATKEQGDENDVITEDATANKNDDNDDVANHNDGNYDDDVHINRVADVDINVHVDAGNGASVDRFVDDDEIRDDETDDDTDDAQIPSSCVENDDDDNDDEDDDTPVDDDDAAATSNPAAPASRQQQRSRRSVRPSIRKQIREDHVGVIGVNIASQVSIGYRRC